jgi:outer membrane protein OmpA-like peptidoglycan-associated protein
MSFRNWLLAGTSIAVLTLAPIGAAHSQDANNPELRAAFAAYQADQSDQNKQALEQACITAGFKGLDDCISALTGVAPADQASSAAPAPSSEAAPPPPPSEAPPAPPVSSEEAAPVAPSSEEAPPPPAAPKNEAPASQPAATETAPASTEAAPTAAPSSDVAPPASAAAPAAAPAGDAAIAKLEAAVKAYNRAVAQLAAGKKNAQRDIDRAKAQIDDICAKAGFADTDTCLAQFNLTLSPLPAAAAEPAAAPSSAPEVSPPAASSQEPASSVPPVSELPKASEAVTPSAVEVLPPDVSAEAAPILDSAKDQQGSFGISGASVEPDQSSASASSAEATQPAAPPGPPPKDDKSAQSDIQPPPPQDLSTQSEKGKPKPADFTFVQPAPPTDNPNVKVIQKPKNDQGGLVFQIGINIFISNPEQERNRFYDPNHGDKVFYEDLSFGRTRETILRRDGTKIVTIYARDGDVLQRSKILPNGREIVLASADPRERDNNNWEDPGRKLPPLVLNIPARDYILDADSADQDQIDFFLDQPPVEKVRQIYTIDDVKRSARLRDSVRRLEIGGLTFDTGKATISRDQVGALAKVAKAMQDVLARNPGSVFLIEGHTDAVGSDVANLVLSDQRASTIARILTDFYDIPAENLVTQGYGERYLKVRTDGPEPLNRRVTIKNITTLVAYVGDK